jgi:RimJ/RimL family protein N-acetyltransferase
MQIPTIETDRLKLRAHKLEDFNDLKMMWAHPEVTKFIGGIPSTDQQSWMRLINYLGHWQLMGFGYWAIEEKSSGKYIGDIGLADFKREITPSIRDTPEAGWALSAEAHGKGYASEALKAVLEWGDRSLKSQKTVCIITPENVKSIELAKKFGYVEMQSTLFNEKAVVLYSRVSNLK